MAVRVRGFKEWKGIFEKWKVSGLGVREFCKAEGVGESRFYDIRRQIETGIDRHSKKKSTKESSKGNEPNREQRFIPIEVSPVTSMVTAQRALNYLEIETPSGYVIRIP